MGTMGGGAGGGGAGGGGAGGGGAGGGGAGGGGAGGGGAGGGGAGGGGADGLGHAGGGSSPLLNTGLATSHDAIVGYWDGTPDSGATGAKFANMPPEGNMLKSLDPNRRVDLLAAELMERFAVTGQVATYDLNLDKFVPGTVAISADGHPIFHTVGPVLEAVQDQLVWLRNYADLRFDRIPEINRQLDDIVSFFGAVTRLDGSSRQHTLEFLTAANQVVYALEMRAKWYTWTPRPIDLSSNVHPIIQTPDHSSFPSGHATEAFAMATLLTRLMKNNTTAQDGMQKLTMPYRLAHRIAVNRTIAGVHYPIDSAAGAVMGCMIGEAIWSMLKNPTNPVTQLQQKIAWLERCIEVLTAKLTKKGKDDALLEALKDAEAQVQSAKAELKGEQALTPQQAYRNWCGTFVPAHYPSPSEFDFLLPGTADTWAMNTPQHVIRAPITEAYDEALEQEW